MASNPPGQVPIPNPYSQYPGNPYGGQPLPYGTGLQSWPRGQFVPFYPPPPQGVQGVAPQGVLGSNANGRMILGSSQATPQPPVTSTAASLPYSSSKFQQPLLGSSQSNIVRNKIQAGQMPTVPPHPLVIFDPRQSSGDATSQFSQKAAQSGITIKPFRYVSII